MVYNTISLRTIRDSKAIIKNNFGLFLREPNTKGMQIEVNNQTNLPKKHIRFVKWKIYKLAEKFKHLLYASVFIKQEGREYQTTVKLGVPGNDIVLKHKHDDVNQLFKTTLDDSLRYLRKHKEKQLNY